MVLKNTDQSQIRKLRFNLTIIKDMNHPCDCQWSVPHIILQRRCNLYLCFISQTLQVGVVPVGYQAIPAGRGGEVTQSNNVDLDCMWMDWCMDGWMNGWTMSE